MLGMARSIPRGKSKRSARRKTEGAQALTKDDVANSIVTVYNAHWFVAFGRELGLYVRVKICA
jgi:hypothetical protein